MYIKTFKSLDEQKEYEIYKWLTENIGKMNTDWKIDVDEQHWVDYGEGNVGVICDVTVKIYNPAKAFVFEIFKIGE